jgi:hypothetical protein
MALVGMITIKENITVEMDRTIVIKINITREILDTKRIIITKIGDLINKVEATIMKIIIIGSLKITTINIELKGETIIEETKRGLIKIFVLKTVMK